MDETCPCAKSAFTLLIAAFSLIVDEIPEKAEAEVSVI